MKRCSFIFFFIAIALMYSCKKNDSGAIADPNTYNKWECKIDGVLCSGTIDTTFLTPASQAGSVPYYSCSGTSFDKKINVFFRFVKNGPQSPLSLMVMDTGSMRRSIGEESVPNSGITFITDSSFAGGERASFSGTIILGPDGGLNGYATHIITEGKLYCEPGIGNNEPKKFVFNTPGFTVQGYFEQSEILANTLVLEGATYGAGVLEEKFKLMVRTGGTVAPGIYESSKGDVGLQYYPPSYFSHYVSDTVGDLSVTILSVENEVVRGSFSGTNEDGTAINSSIFSCRIRNYHPQADGIGKWKFGVDESISNYRMYGGNILNASLSFQSGKNYLTLNGESDNGSAVFKMIIGSQTAIGPGMYSTSSFSNSLDSLYFISTEKLWNGNPTYFFTEQYSGNPAYCSIDSIIGNKVYGSLYGFIRKRLSSSGSTGSGIHNGSFVAILN